MAFYFSRRKIKPKDDEESTELNIVPYLDILMNLIIFMLLSLTGLATFGILNVNAPSYGGGAGDNAEKPPLNLTVAIGKKGFYIAGTGGVLPGGSDAPAAGTPPGDAAPAIPLKADGTYNYPALTAQMKQVKTGFPAETKLILAAEAETQFEVLIATMDATRETEDRKLLFPDVTLASF
jgi:biopolymer transport protein TolR